MTCYLLTGASGLLGSYLLCNCLLTGHRMAQFAIRTGFGKHRGASRSCAGLRQTVARSEET